jgi:hypothetical protein
MLSLPLIIIALSHYMIRSTSEIMIGKLSHQIYVPSSPIINPPIVFNYSNSCSECLCYAVSSTTISYVAINCLTDRHLCLCYTSYASNYSFQSNITSDLYFFQLPPSSTTTVSSQMTTYTTSTMTVSGWRPTC